MWHGGEQLRNIKRLSWGQWEDVEQDPYPGYHGKHSGEGEPWEEGDFLGSFWSLSCWALIHWPWGDEGL